MELSALVRALEVLSSPLEWGGREAWLAECLRQVRAARGVDADGLEELLALPGDEPGWLRRALEEAGERVLPSGAAAADFQLVSLRCALNAGLATLARLTTYRGTLGQAFDDVDTGMAVFAGDGWHVVVRNARWDEMLAEEPDHAQLVELVAKQAVSAGGGAADTAVEVELAGGCYRVVASRVAAGCGSHSGCAAASRRWRCSRPKDSPTPTSPGGSG